MADYIIIDPNQLPLLIASAFTSFSMLGFMIGRELEKHKE